MRRSAVYPLLSVALIVTVLVALTAGPANAIPSIVSAEVCVDASGFEFDVLVSEPDAVIVAIQDTEFTGSETSGR